MIRRDGASEGISNIAPCNGFFPFSTVGYLLGPSRSSVSPKCDIKSSHHYKPTGMKNSECSHDPAPGRSTSPIHTVKPK